MVEAVAVALGGFEPAFLAGWQCWAEAGDEQAQEQLLGGEGGAEFVGDD